MKQCIYCKQEFTPTFKKGHDQLYCSHKCSGAAARSRREERLSGIINNNNSLKNYNGKEFTTTEKNYGNSTHSNNDRRTMDRADISGRSVTDSTMATFEKYYEAKIEAAQYRMESEMKNSIIEENNKEIIYLKETLKKAEGTIERCLSKFDEEDEQEEAPKDIISGILYNFKTDPATTINFATTIAEIFSKKIK